MRIDKFIILIVVALLAINSASAQIYKTKPENFFGLQFKPLIPFGLVGDRALELEEENFETSIEPILGYSYGGAVRIGLTELLAIETGINYTRRNYRASYSVADSNLYANDELGYVSFDIPVNFLVYIKLGKEMFMNVSIGASGNFNASNIKSIINPYGKHQFIFEGKRLHFFDFNANANLGFEYRTRKSGTFYLGISGKVPFSSTLAVATEYRYGTEGVVTRGIVEGASFSLDLKYFFHNQKRKKGTQFNKGPIEQ